MTVRAKFVVQSITNTVGGTAVSLWAVTSGSEENKTFFKLTPSAEIKLATINPDAAAEFVPGKEFYVDFTAA